MIHVIQQMLILYGKRKMVLLGSLKSSKESIPKDTKSSALTVISVFALVSEVEDVVRSNGETNGGILKFSVLFEC